MTKAIENAATTVQLKIRPKCETLRLLVLFTCTALVTEIVASCQLTSGQYVCRCIDGYRVVGNITNALTVEIISVLPKHAVIYWCGGFEPHPLERTKCKLSVKDKINEDVMPTSSVVVNSAAAMLTLVTCFVVNRLSTDVY